MPNPDIVDTIKNNHELIEAGRSDLIKFFKRMLAREIFWDQSADVRLNNVLINVTLSRCFSCERLAIWIADDLLYPAKNIYVIPNEDMPPDVKVDYIEAGLIVDKSPRGASALLRLCIQKLLRHLGQAGKNLNEEIAALVKKGLDPRIQQALDVVRVIGNNAVHPGEMNLRDDKATALQLFNLVNLIVESTISIPKQIQTMYERLPSQAVAAIEKRDGNAATKTSELP